MNYTEATRLSRQMSGGMTKTALESWQRAGLGATGGGLLAYTMASLINPSMSRRGKILSTLAGMGTGAAAGYRFLPGYGSGKAPAGAGNDGNAGNATTDAKATTAQAQAPAQTAAKTPAKTQTKAPAQTQAPAHAKEPAQTAAQTPAQEVAPAENLGSLGATPAVEPAPAATPAPAPAPTPTATPATAPAAAPAATGQEDDDDVSGAVYRTLGGLGLGLGGAGLYAGKKILKNRHVRQFGARRQQVRENQDTYAAWSAASQAPSQTAAGGGKVTTISVEDLRRELDMEYRSRMRLDPDVLPDITHFDPAGYQLDKMGPRNAAKFLREISLGFNPSIPREVQLEALKTAFRRNAEQVLRYDAPYWPFMIRNRIKEKAINALKKDDWRFKAHLKTDVGERGYDKALFNSDYIPIRLQNGKYSLRKISPFETHDPISASEIDESERYRAVMRGTHDVWDAKQYGGRLVPNREGEVYGWVPEMAPIHEPKPARAARLARAVSAGSKVLSILLRALNN